MTGKPPPAPDVEPESEPPTQLSEPTGSAPQVPLEAGLVVAERFRLVRPLGQGGMGAVWAAQHTELDTPCALKFMHESAAKSAEVVARFKREARAAAQLRSPHVVQILDHGVWRGIPYIAMELLEGEDLHRRLRRQRALSPREVVSIASQVGRALTKAHAAGLVHRDLKPANIFLTRDDEREIAKVLDFGVAKATAGSALAEANTSTGTVLGTPFYMSPEHLRAEKSVDHRTDLWALSVVVYQCLVGKLPFRGDALAELVVKIMVDPIPVPSQAAPERGLPWGFDAWWARAVDRDINKRFQTAKDLTEALALALDVSLSAGPGSISSLSAVLPPPAPPAPPVEELDSGLLHTAMPTVTPSPFTMGETPKPPPQAPGSGPIQPPLPPGLRPKPPLRIIVPAVGLVVAAVVALVAFRGGDPTPSDTRDAASGAVPAAPAPPAPTVVTPGPTPPAADAPSATPAASASSAPAPKTSHASTMGETPKPPPQAPAPSPPPQAAKPAPAAPAKPRPKHEGVTDF